MESDKRIKAFLDVLNPTNTTTGGGTASAIAGAMAAGLAGMVARLSPGKPGMEPDEFYTTREASLSALAEELFSGGWQDTAAFGAVKEAYRLPKESEQEIAARQKAVQAAWIQATELPLNNAAKCAEVFSLAADLEGRSNQNAASDLRCAQYLSYVGILGCLQNVAINLPMIKDEALADSFARRADTLREKAAQQRAHLSAFEWKTP